MRPVAALALLLALGAGPAAAAPAKDTPAKDTPAKDAPAKDVPAKDALAKDAPAPEAWVRQVHAIVVRSMASLSATLPRGAYAVHFSIDEQGRGSRYGVESGAAQAAAITAALAARSFPAPPDGASHALSFTVRMK